MSRVIIYVEKMFLVKKGVQRNVTTYADLERLHIGTVLGFKYFPAFDQDKDLKKDPAATLEKSVRMLLAGRVDVVIASDAQYNSLLRENKTLLDQTQICSYVHDEYNPVHIGISKASKFGSGEYLNAFKSVVQQMYENGEIHLIRKAFYEDYDTGSEQ
jgi:polar amino acid transport system substrate-binding protein